MIPRQRKVNRDFSGTRLSDVDPERPSGGPVMWLVIMCAIGIMIGAVISVLVLLAS